MIEIKNQILSVTDDTEPVTLDEAKQYLDVDFTNDDARITVMISAARQMVENYINRDVLPRRRLMYIPKLDGQTVELQYTPLSDSTVTIEINGTVTQEDTEWERYGPSKDPYIEFENPYSEKVSITYTTDGLASDDTVKQGVLSLLYCLYNDKDIKPHVWAIIKPLKKTFV